MFPQTKVRENSKVGLTQMDKDRNLQNRVGIQMSQIQIVKVKETMKERRNWKSKAAEKKRNVNDRLVSILRRNSNPTANPPGTKLLRRKNSDIDEVEKI
jgi:CO dehydrogenase nickel-insertion accessory protein CooC1